MESNARSIRRYVAPLLVAALFTSVAFTGVAVGEARVFIADAQVQQDAALVGERATVDVTLRNTGDQRGAIILDVTANGTEVASKQVPVEAGEYKNTTVRFTVDRPGDYRVRVDDRSAGRLRVGTAKASTQTDREDGRTVLVQAAGAADGETVRASFPPADGAPFAVESVSMAATGSRYNRTVASYAPTGAAPFAVPDGDAATVVGAVDAEPVDGGEVTGLRVSVARSALGDAGLSASAVTVYAGANGSFEALSTERVGSTSDAIVYEATGGGAEQSVVGSLSPAFALGNRTLETRSTSDGKVITVTAAVHNEGYVTGDHTAKLRVDGTVVDQRTVTVAGGQTATVTLNYTVGDQGTYDVTVDGQTVGSVVVTGDESGGDGGGLLGDGKSGDGSTEAGEGGAGGPSNGGSSLPDLGDVGLLELGLGAAVVLLGGGLLFALRR